jgi:hypothetical protein
LPPSTSVWTPFEFGGVGVTGRIDPRPADPPVSYLVGTPKGRPIWIALVV